MSRAATKCPACAVATRVTADNEKVYLAALADCLVGSVEDVVKQLCALHRNKLAIARALADQAKRSGS